MLLNRYPNKQDHKFKTLNKINLNVKKNLNTAIDN